MLFPGYVGAANGATLPAPGVQQGRHLGLCITLCLRVLGWQFQAQKWGVCNLQDPHAARVSGADGCWSIALETTT
jgi:hypothetical protein